MSPAAKAAKPTYKVIVEIRATHWAYIKASSPRAAIRKAKAIFDIDYASQEFTSLTSEGPWKAECCDAEVRS